MDRRLAAIGSGDFRIAPPGPRDNLCAMSETVDYPCIRNVGLEGLLVSFGASFSDAANHAALAFCAHIRTLHWPEVIETTTSLVSAFFRMDLVTHSPDAMRDRLAEHLAARDWSKAPLAMQRRLWTLPATLSGPQFDEVLGMTGLSADEARADLTAGLRVLTLGFAPGQPYLGHLPPAWNMPRQTGLTAEVPSGAIVAAVRQLCLFSNAAPTGWRHVGQTAFKCFRPGTEAPFPLSPGDEIRFAEVSEAELEEIRARDTSGNGGAESRVLE